MRQPTFALRLIRYAQITPGVREFSSQRADGEPLAYEAGQFLNIHFEHDGRPMHRSYSVANPPAADGVVDFAVTPVDNGRATRLLFALEAGDLIDASGPYGRFVLHDDPPCRYVLVGTGTGIAPYRAMLPTIERHLRDGGHRFVLLLGVRSEQELLYGDEFREFANQHPGFDFHGCLSREALEFATEALTTSAHTNFRTGVLMRLGEVLRQAGERAPAGTEHSAEIRLREAIALARELSAESWEVEAAMSLAAL